MLFSLKSLCSSAGAPSGTRWRSSQFPSSACSASVPSSSAASPRLRQPLTARARNPAGRPRSSRPDRGGIHRMDRRQRLEQHLRQPGADFRAAGQFGRDVLADHQAGPIFDDLELRADDTGVRAQEQPARHERQRIGQPAQDAELARHVVGAGGKFAERRPAQHGRPAVEMDQVVQVRQSAGELPRRRIAVESQAVCRPGTRARHPNRAERSAPPCARRPAAAGIISPPVALTGERVLRLDPTEHAAPGRLAQQPVRIAAGSTAARPAGVARRDVAGAATRGALRAVAAGFSFRGAMPSPPDANVPNPRSR